MAITFPPIFEYDMARLFPKVPSPNTAISFINAVLSLIYPISTFFSGKSFMCWSILRFLANAITIVIGPTHPKNIKTIIISLPARERLAVKFMLKPTVPIAENAS